ncbi:bacterioferritin [Magnetospirillum sulfuroxidans]|uniref:Bacterioferritin n=1 Tax=Magnetospirillum sulfuroxidans TaxID=611300 RepID=A0ABS5ID70_9PROT|nr:bacterioferritin [Magnetospirillum sulfuroxidans]MBR9972345.1 bacterioferritin [Magnetospirillum sulfuroxidans]
MQGSQKVISILNKLLTGELTAADQYFVHARMLENWGFKVLHARIEHERHDELEHAGLLINRILFLEGTPDVASRSALRIGADVPKMLANDLAYELEVVEELKSAIAVCESERDYDTRRILVHLLEETEQDHVRWLEVQVGLIEKLGLKNYLQSAAGELASSAS